MIQHFNHFIPDLIEGILFQFFVDGLFGFAVAAQIDQQYIKVFTKITQLPEPDGTTATRTVYEGYPFGMGIPFICSKV
jgi:hypothetical protein